jgi:signal peptidase I
LDQLTEAASVGEPSMTGDRVLEPGNAGSRARRKPWLAALLTILTIGLGHLYVGRPRRAVLAFAACTLGSIAAIVLTMSSKGFAQVAAYLATVLVTYAAPAWDAGAIARRTGPDYRLRWYNRWYVYLGIAALGALTWQPWIRRWMIANVAEAFTIPSESMAPTIAAGDRLFARPWRGSIARGQLVVYRRSNENFVSRVVGVPLDTLSMRSGTLTVNGHRVAEPYARLDSADATYPELAWQSMHLAPGVRRDSYRPSMTTWGPLVVPAGSYFLLGDNRGDSFDSRLAGFVARDSIVKQPTTIYFSRDPNTGEVRWSRVGRELRP